MGNHYNDTLVLHFGKAIGDYLLSRSDQMRQSVLEINS